MLDAELPPALHELTAMDPAAGEGDARWEPDGLPNSISSEATVRPRKAVRRQIAQ